MIQVTTTLTELLYIYSCFKLHITGISVFTLLE